MLPKNIKSPDSLALPKTGQLTSYETNDDGALELGWWRGALQSQNRTRFITRRVPDEIGGDTIVLDKATGLMWPQDWSSAAGNNGSAINWADAMAFADGQGSLTFAGFSDWRMPNVNELFVLTDWNTNTNPCTWSIFTNIAYHGLWHLSTYWTSTTFGPNVTYGILVDFIDGRVYARIKTNAQVWCVAVRGGL